MKVLEHGEDRWRRVECIRCHSILVVDDCDVLAEQFWDAEDGCLDWRYQAVCAVCGDKLRVHPPRSVIVLAQGRAK